MKLIPSLAFICATFVFAACEKKPRPAPTPTPPTPSAFALNLKKECGNPFKGKGDSMDVYLPTAFSPNGDGKNDMYGLMPTSTGFSMFSIDIYDTLGTLVFRSDIASGHIWDGTAIKNGAPSWKYKYYVKIKYTTAGNVTDSGGTYLFLLTPKSDRTCVYSVSADSGKYLFPDEFSIGSGFGAFGTMETFCN